MRKIAAPKAREYFAERVKMNSKTLCDMADIVRRHPGEFKVEDVEKVRAYLMQQVEAAVKGMTVSVTTQVRADFDFDMELPTAPVFQDRSEVMRATRPAPEVNDDEFAALERLDAVEEAYAAPAKPVVQMREKPAGRLFGTKEVIKELVPVAPTAAAREAAKTLTAVHDKTGMIEDSGFIDDRS
jgi:hypothetical protein